MEKRPRGLDRNVKAGLALLCAAAACAIVIAAGGCGDDDLVFPGGTPPATGTAPTQTVSTATPTPSQTGTPATATPRNTVAPPVCSQLGQPCNILRPCCTGQCLPAPLSICLS